MSEKDPRNVFLKGQWLEEHPEKDESGAIIIVMLLQPPFLFLSPERRIIENPGQSLQTSL